MTKQLTETRRIKAGARQGNVISPQLLTLALEPVMNYSIAHISIRTLTKANISKIVKYQETWSDQC